MKVIQLPNGQTASIIEKSEVTERQSRAVINASMESTATAAKLAGLGFNDDDPTTWGVLDQVPNALDRVQSFHGTLISTMVKAWSLGDLPTLDSALDLPKETFDALATACATEFAGASLDIDPHIDPKAPTGDLPA